MKKMAVAGTGLVILVAVSFLTFYQADPSILGFNGEKAFSIAMVAVTALVMLIGIFFGCFYRRISTSAGQINLFAELRSVVSSRSFVASLCVAPFVFFAVYATVKQRPGDPASLLLAFENGFFCESIFRKMFPSDGTQNTRLHEPG